MCPEKAHEYHSALTFSSVRIHATKHNSIHATVSENVPCQGVDYSIKTKANRQREKHCFMIDIKNNNTQLLLRYLPLCLLFICQPGPPWRV